MRSPSLVLYTYLQGGMKTYRAELLMLPGLYTHWTNPPLGLWLRGPKQGKPEKNKKYFTLETLPASHPASSS